MGEDSRPHRWRTREEVTSVMSEMGCTRSQQPWNYKGRNMRCTLLMHRDSELYILSRIKSIGSWDLNVG